MLFVSYSRRVRQTCLRAIAAGGARPARPEPGRDRLGTDERGAPGVSGLTVYASFPAIYDRTPEPALPDHGRRPDR